MRAADRGGVRVMRLKLAFVVLSVAACTCHEKAAVQAGPVKKVRRAAMAGSFYPGDPAELEAQVKGLLGHATKVATSPVKMVLAPHAGTVFSGPVAAEAFKQLRPGFERVVILAGNHDGSADFAGVSVERSTHWAMPGFEVKVAAAAEQLLSNPLFVDVPAVHAMHMIEIELPFLRAADDRPFELVPLIVGRITREQARALAFELAKLDDGKTLFVVSVDLSHYYPYAEAVSLDRPCLDSLVAADSERVIECVTDATQVLLVMNELAGKLALTPRLLTYANSGDVSGDKSRVVGYGAIAYEDRFELTQAEGAELVALARRSLEATVREGRELRVPDALGERWPRLLARRSAFVTLKERGELRGCIGSLEPHQALAADVVQNAASAAIRDSRFSPVRAEELPAIDLSISVLDIPRPMEPVPPDALASLLGQSKPGLILEFHGRRSTFLPEVWDELPQPGLFLSELCLKQGAPGDCWRAPATRFQSYGSQHFAEPARPRK